MTAKYILLGLWTVSLGMQIALHGKKRSRHNAWHSIISYAIIMMLLYWSDFFNDL